MIPKTLKNLSLKTRYPNARQLNINRILTTKSPINIINTTNGQTYDNSDIGMINTIFNNNVSRHYNIIKYLGEGLHGSLYLANDNEKKRYICKKIILDNYNNYNNDANDANDKNDNQYNQLEFELNILNYLSSNKFTREHINPCLEHKIIENQIFTIFPIFNGYSLQHLLKYLAQIEYIKYYNIVFHLIKNILQGLAKIHQTNLAHQNINDNSILVSTYEKPGQITVKFTDFGIGCGYKNDTNINTSSREDKNFIYNPVNLQNYKNDIFFKMNSCKNNNYTPVKITPEIIEQLSKSDYMLISQKYDLLCLGMIFVKLLLFFEKLDIDFTKGYSTEFIENIKKIIALKYSLNINVNNDKNLNYDNMFVFLNKLSNKTKCNTIKQKIIEYLKIIWKYIFCKTANRQSCQYVLDKLIIYEKYKDDDF